MNRFNRRKFLKLLGLSGAAVSVAGFLSSCSKGTSARVVIVGGGFGGATCAKYLLRFDSSLQKPWRTIRKFLPVRSVTWSLAICRRGQYQS